MEEFLAAIQQPWFLGLHIIALVIFLIYFIVVSIKEKKIAGISCFFSICISTVIVFSDLVFRPFAPVPLFIVQFILISALIIEALGTIMAIAMADNF